MASGQETGLSTTEYLNKFKYLLEIGFLAGIVTIGDSEGSAEAGAGS